MWCAAPCCTWSAVVPEGALTGRDMCAVGPHSFLRNARLLNSLHNKNKKKVNKMSQKRSVVLGQTVSFIDFSTSEVVEGKVDGIDVIVTGADGSAYCKSIVSLFDNAETAKVKLRRDLQKQIQEHEKSLAELRKRFDKV